MGGLPLGAAAAAAAGLTTVTAASRALLHHSERAVARPGTGVRIGDVTDAPESGRTGADIAAEEAVRSTTYAQSQRGMS